MKTLLILLTFSATAFCQLITSGPNKELTVDQVIGYRIDGLIGKVKKAEDENKAAQDALAVVQKKDKAKDDMITWQSGQIVNLTIWGNQQAQAVKSLSEIAAILFSAYLGSILAGIVLKNFPSFEGPVAVAAIYVLLFLSSYYLLDATIVEVAKFIPTVPVWNDISQHFAKLHAPKL